MIKIHRTRGSLVLYRSPECWGYVELEQTWKYISTQCCISFHPCRSIQTQIWPCRKIGQGQLRVIIWTNLKVLEYPMLHTKFQGHWPFGSREKDFLRFLPYMGMAAILVMWHRPFEQTFIPLSHGGSTWNLVSIGLEVSKEKTFENVNLMEVNEWPWPLIFI